MGNEFSKITSPKERRLKNTFVKEISPDLTVRMKRMDMLTLMMSGTMPLHLLEAATKFEQMENKILDLARKGEDPTEAEKALDAFKSVAPEDMAKTTEFLRYYAMAVVVEPQLVPTEEDVKNEDKQMAVTDLAADELLKIFYAVPPEGKEPPVMTPDQAADFRREKPVSPAEAGHPGEEVRPPTKFVDYGDREGIRA